MTASELTTIAPWAQGIDFQSVFQTAPIAMIVLDRELRYVACNDAMAEINGIPSPAHIGRTVGELLPELAEVEARFRSVLANGRSTRDMRVVGVTPKAPGVRRVWLESIRPLRDATGATTHLLVAVQEITALEAAQASLRDSERTFRASQQLRADSFSILRAVRRPDGQVCDFTWEYANPSAEARLQQGTLVGLRLLEVVPGSRENPALFPRYVRLLAQSAPDEVELEIEKDGVRRLYRNSAVAIDGERLAVAMQDLSDHLRTEEHLRLVSAEFHHRVRNVIAVTMGMVAQSAKSAADLPGFSKDLLRRLEALGRAQDLLVTSSGAVPLEDIVRGALRPFSCERLRIRMGPPVLLQEPSVVPVALALNELATNAIKHGALAGPEGWIDFGWTTAAREVVLTWSETSPRPVEPPSHTGLGTRLLADAAAKVPGGRLRQEFAPSGLQVEIRFEAEPAG